MTRYRQQVKRALRERDAQVAKELDGRPRRKLRVGEPIPADALPGEVFDVAADVEGSEMLLARFRWTGGPPSRSLQVVTDVR